MSGLARRLRIGFSTLLTWFVYSPVLYLFQRIITISIDFNEEQCKPWGAHVVEISNGCHGLVSGSYIFLHWEMPGSLVVGLSAVFWQKHLVVVHICHGQYQRRRPFLQLDLRTTCCFWKWLITSGQPRCQVYPAGAR